LHASAGNGKVDSRREVDRLLERLFNAATRCVVNVADPFWQNVSLTGAPNVCLVASQADHPGVSQHLTAGGATAILEPAGLLMQARGTQAQYYPAEVAFHDAEWSDMRLANAIATAAFLWLARTQGTAGGETFACRAKWAAAVHSNNRTSDSEFSRRPHGVGRKQMIDPRMDRITESIWASGDRPRGE
jgi:hypothetical protein